MLQQHSIDVAIGDRFRIGTALVEVSQGRQPCFRLNLRFEAPGVALRILAAGMRGLGPQWWLAEAQLEVQIDDLVQGLRTRRELGS